MTNENNTTKIKKRRLKNNLCGAVYRGCAGHAGGDNVHRGMVPGLIVGAANDELPQHLKQGLTAFDDLQGEIDAFADMAVNGQGI